MFRDHPDTVCTFCGQPFDSFKWLHCPCQEEKVRTEEKRQQAEADARRLVEEQYRAQAITELNRLLDR